MSRANKPNGTILVTVQDDKDDTDASADLPCFLVGKTSLCWLRSSSWQIVQQTQRISAHVANGNGTRCNRCTGLTATFARFDIALLDVPILGGEYNPLFVQGGRHDALRIIATTWRFITLHFRNRLKCCQ